MLNKKAPLLVSCLFLTDAVKKVLRVGIDHHKSAGPEEHALPQVVVAFLNPVGLGEDLNGAQALRVSLAAQADNLLQSIRIKHKVEGISYSSQ